MRHFNPNLALFAPRLSASPDFEMMRRPMSHNFRVDTSFNKDINISETVFDGPERIERLSRDILQLREDGVRQALIALGWTPPPEAEP